MFFATLSLQLLEESRIMQIREVLLRLDQANKGMLECLLGPGGTLEALSIALSRIDSVQDANAQLLHMRKYAGMRPLPSVDESSGADAACSLSDGVDDVVRIEHGAARAVCAGDKKLAAITQARTTTGAEILELPEDGVEKTFEGGREGLTEAVRVVQEMCCCLAEVQHLCCSDIFTGLCRLPPP